MTIAILGAGLTGCTLARLLAERGEEVVVLEAADEYGGLCRSISMGGFTFDLGGSHIIFSRDEEVLAWMRGVLGENRRERHRETKCFYGGRYVHYPFENGLADLTPGDRFHCVDGFVRAVIAAELAAARGESAPAPTFLDWIYRTFGKGIADCYLVPYNEKIWKYPLDEMSAHWVDGRVPRPPLDDVLRSACGIRTEGYSHQAVFTYPAAGGIEALVRSIASPIQDRIICGFCVRSIWQEGDRFLLSDGDRTVSADHCISTIPVQALVRALGDPTPELEAAVDGLVYNGVACVFLGLRAPVPPYSWVYLPGPELGYANRVSFPSNYSEVTAPDGCGSVLAECTYRPGDPVAEMEDDALVDHVVDRLEAMGVLSADDVVVTGVARQPFAYVVYDLGHQGAMRVIRSFVAARGIDLVGRFAEFEYLNMDACIRHAIDFVRGYRPCG